MPLRILFLSRNPNPNCTSQRRRFFQVWLPLGLPRLAEQMRSCLVPLVNLENQPMQRLPKELFAPGNCFHYASEFDTQRLAHVLDSLVRVTRRVAENRSLKILCA